MLNDIQASSPASGSVASARRPVLRLEKLSKTFGGTRALREVALEIAPGEIHALVGQNGCGKSTLIKTLAGYHQADPGALAWLGRRAVRSLARDRRPPRPASLRPPGPRSS